MSDSPAKGDQEPFEEQRQLFELLSQETRHLILQFILGHPHHLPSLDELAYMIPKNKAGIREQAARLEEAGIVRIYDHPPNEQARDVPSKFYGLTEFGVDVLSEYKYLRGLPIARAVYDNTRLSAKAERHLEAPRPELPAPIRNALHVEESGSPPNRRQIISSLRDRTDNTHDTDAMVRVLEAFFKAGIGPDDEGITSRELTDLAEIDSEYQPRTLLEQLVDSGFLEVSEPSGPDVFAISERRDAIVSGDVTAEAEENIEALIAHIDDELQPVELADTAPERDAAGDTPPTPSMAVSDGAGRTIRSILAAEFNVAPERVGSFLREGDPVAKLNTAVTAIESSEEMAKAEDYGHIVFVKQADQYRLSETATQLAME